MTTTHRAVPVLREASPQAIDTVLAHNWIQQEQAVQKIEWAKDSVRQAAGQHRDYRDGGRWNGTFADATSKAWELGEFDKTYLGRQANDALNRFHEAETVLDDLVADAKPYEDEYRARQWNRYFLVNNTNGHVHRDRNCSTCFPTTQYRWIPSLSGCEESELVAEYGELACTVCFPDAPTYKGFSDGTSAIARYTAAEKAERAAEKAAKKAAKDAKNLVEPVRIGGGRGHLVETIYTAKQEIKSAVEFNIWYDEDPIRNETIRVLTDALAQRNIDVAPLIAKWTKAAKKEVTS